MANSIYKIRTNYVRITDVDKFNDIISHCIIDGGEEIKIITHTDENDVTRYGFYCEECIDGMRIPGVDCNETNCKNCPDFSDCDGDCEYEAFIKELQTVIAPDDALIITTFNYEKMRYLAAYADIVTCKKWKYIELADIAVDNACKLLGNKDWTTQNEY